MSAAKNNREKRMNKAVSRGRMRDGDTEFLAKALSEKAQLEADEDSRLLELEAEKELAKPVEASEDAVEEPERPETTNDSNYSAETDAAPQAEQEGSRELRIAMVGNVDSGKSTLVGVLSKGSLDDGRGGARSHVFKHRHEQGSGRTSAVATELMGFATEGHQVIGNERAGVKARWTEVVQKSQKTVSLIDLCGHERYLKTTIFGMTAMAPDAALVVVGANMGVQHMTREHVGVATALQIPVLVVVTKVDICPPEILKDTRQTLNKVLKTAGRMPFYIREDAHVTTAAQSLYSDRVTPIFLISNVTGQNIDRLKRFIRELPCRPKKLKGAKGGGSKQQDGGSKDPSNTKGSGNQAQDHDGGEGASGDCSGVVVEGESARFVIDSVFHGVPGVACVVAGVMQRPGKSGEFVPVLIRSIERLRVPVDRAEAGQSASFSIRAVSKKTALKKAFFRKGMVMVQPQGHGGPHTPLPPPAEWPVAYREFDAEILLLHHQTTVGVGFESLVHAGVVRQTAKLIAIAVRPKKGGKGGKGGKGTKGCARVRQTGKAANAKMLAKEKYQNT